jgi:hypothetical protein
MLPRLQESRFSLSLLFTKPLSSVFIAAVATLFAMLCEYAEIFLN